MNQVTQLLTKLYRQTDTQLSHQMVKILDGGAGIQRILDLSVDPRCYSDAATFRSDNNLCELTRKLRLPGDEPARQRATLANFYAAEHSCKRTNMRLARYLPQTQSLTAEDLPVMSFIDSWRKNVRRVLGRWSGPLHPRFSGGSTLSDTGRLTTIPDKMSSKPTCYQGALDRWHAYLYATPQYERYPWPCIERGNKFFQVPKDSRKNRGCCMEASAPLSLQLAAGAVIKDRLRKWYGSSLASLPLRHRRLACLASAGRLDLATIDLSMASDTLSYALVELILPKDWFDMLNSLRAPITRVEGRDVRLEKFSSMGNGFTFELESLLFATLGETIVGHDRYISVFGDDIILETKFAPAMINALRFFGFETNKKKTFCEGPFRESCGGDFFLGKPVRAHYMEELPDEPQQWIALANGLDRAGYHRTPAWYYCVDQVPKPIRSCRGPSSLGDLVIRDEVEPVFRTYKTLTGGVWYANSPAPFYRVYRPIVKSFDLGSHFSYRVATAAASLGVKSRFSARDSIRGYRLDWVCAWGVTSFGWCSES